MKLKEVGNRLILVMTTSDEEADWIKNIPRGKKTSKQIDIEAHQEAKKIHAENIKKDEVSSNGNNGA